MAKTKQSLKAVDAVKARKNQRSRKKRRAILLGVEVIVLLLLIGVAFFIAK